MKTYRYCPRAYPSPSSNVSQAPAGSPGLPLFSTPPCLPSSAFSLKNICLTNALSLHKISPSVFLFKSCLFSLQYSSEPSLPYKILTTPFFNTPPHWIPLCTPPYLDVCVWSDKLLQALNGTHKKWAVGGENLEERR